MSDVSDEGWQRLSADEFAKRLGTGDRPVPSPVQHPLETILYQSQGLGLAHNLSTQLAFIGEMDIIELQALGCHRRAGDSYEVTRAAHARAPADAIRLAVESETFITHGVYLLPAKLRSGVETRHTTPGSWYEIPSKGGTTDSDVQSRRVLAIDFDVQRPSNTSATDEEMAKSILAAVGAWEYLSGALGSTSSMAYLHSGNGRQIHLALDDLHPDETKSMLSSLLAGVASLFDTPHVRVDTKLYDAKRILPACGTVKRKGAPGIAERPHRRTAIYAPETVVRLSLEAVKDLSRKIWGDTDDKGRGAMREALGIRAPSVTPITPNPGSPFDLANAVSPEEVASWVGILDDRGRPTCPGCGETSGVAILNHGLKCHHNRCQGKGRNGFRTNVDLVAEIQRVEPIEAAKLLGKRFGFEVASSSPAPQTSTPVLPSVPQVSFAPVTIGSIQWVSSAEIFAPLPQIKWLVPELHLVRGRPTLVAGYGFSGKTLTAQALALSLASTAPVWGRFMLSESTTVRHIDYEQGKYATFKRYQRLSVGAGIDVAALVASNKLQVSVFPDVYLDTTDAADIYARAVEGASLVILDALRGATPTIDENDSTIRRCLDNLTRVSEKTGTAFLVLHHAGKTRDQEGDDPRKLPRGSSAIFDACGCVLTIDGEKNRPKKVTQTKSPAEAEGKPLDDFFLTIDDVDVGGQPTAGLRVLYRTQDEVQSQTGAAVRFQQLKDSIVALVASVPGLTSANSICQRVAGGSKDSKLAAIRELVADGKLVQMGGSGCPFTIDSGGGVSGGLDRSQNRWTGPEVPTPLRGGTGGPPPETDYSETERRPTTARKTDSERAAQSDRDSEELLKVDPKEWKSHAASTGWSDARFDSAKALARRKRSARKADADTLESLPAETDKRAWATEQEWSDERIKRAMALLTKDGGVDGR